MSDFLLELLSEEIPARMQEKACVDLERLFAAEIARAGLKAESIEIYATPRRLALIALQRAHLSKWETPTVTLQSTGSWEQNK